MADQKMQRAHLVPKQLHRTQSHQPVWRLIRHSSLCRMTTKALLLSLTMLPERPLCADTPISASDYAASLGMGFATSWFKTQDPSKYYSNASLDASLQLLQNQGYGNLRLRSDSQISGFADIQTGTDTSGNPVYSAPTVVDTQSMNTYLGNLTQAVNVSLAHNLHPVISWLNDAAETRASDQDKTNFVSWWTSVANNFKNADSRISFNLTTEVGSANSGLYNDQTKFIDWTTSAIAAIRATGGNNATRVIIVGAPKSGKSTSFSAYPSSFWTDSANAGHLMFELHDYAAGPNNNGTSVRAWTTGTDAEKANVTGMMDQMVQLRETLGAPGYYGAWMPFNNSNGTVTSAEAVSFAHFFAYESAIRGLPWSINEVTDYFNTIAGTTISSETVGGVTLDIAAIRSSFESGWAEGLAAVPEPASYGFVCAGMGVVAVVRRRRRMA